MNSKSCNLVYFNLILQGNAKKDELQISTNLLRRFALLSLNKGKQKANPIPSEEFLFFVSTETGSDVGEWVPESHLIEGGPGNITVVIDQSYDDSDSDDESESEMELSLNAADSRWHITLRDKSLTVSSPLFNNLLDGFDSDEEGTLSESAAEVEAEAAASPKEHEGAHNMGLLDEGIRAFEEEERARMLRRQERPRGTVLGEVWAETATIC
jgi:hypothetical protein